MAVVVWSWDASCVHCESYLFSIFMKLGFTPREEHTLRVFKSSVLRKIFGPKRDEVTQECR
jgi:hypothetical protein